MAFVALLVGLVGLVTAVLARRQVRRLEAAVAELRGHPAPAAPGRRTPAVTMTKTAPLPKATEAAPISRDTMLAVVHQQLAGLEHQRRAAQSVLVPEDALPHTPQSPQPPTDDDGLPRLAPPPPGRWTPPPGCRRPAAASGSTTRV
ncbi:hypothetical protein [Kitasatospora acidiphila]|nr:hypothetical protein [Kitasatospora acidiphila]